MIDPKLNLLLGSGGFGGHPDTLKSLFEEARNFFSGAKKIILLGYAQENPSAPLETIAKFGLSAEVVSSSEISNPREAVASADGVIVWGGNTFRLLTRLYEHNLVDVVHERALQGMRYMGVSAGTNVSAPTMRTTNDMPILQPPSFNAFNLVPFQINPHYIAGAQYTVVDGRYVKYAGETRDDRLNEFHQENGTPIIALPEGSFLKVRDAKVRYECVLPLRAKLFRKNQTPELYEPGTDLTSLLI